jgi:hypothetical protein
MFTANITNKNFKSGVLQITVDFSNGSEIIKEAFNIVSEDDLNQRIEARLKQLNNLATLASTLTTGAWVAPTKPEPLAPTQLQLAEQTLRELKDKINLGVLKETDQEWTDAVTAYKTLASAEGK